MDEDKREKLVAEIREAVRRMGPPSSVALKIKIKAPPGCTCSAFEEEDVD
jgi:hypothetical protein